MAASAQRRLMWLDGEQNINWTGAQLREFPDEVTELLPALYDGMIQEGLDEGPVLDLEPFGLPYEVWLGQPKQVQNPNVQNLTLCHRTAAGTPTIVAPGSLVIAGYPRELWALPGDMLHLPYKVVPGLYQVHKEDVQKMENLTSLLVNPDPQSRPIPYEEIPRRRVVLLLDYDSTRDPNRFRRKRSSTSSLRSSTSSFGSPGSAAGA